MKQIEYNSELQKLLIEMMISDGTVFSIVQTIIKPEYWDREYRKTIEVILEYTEKYRAIPTIEILKAETGKDYKIINLDKNMKEWFYDTIENFCKHKSMEKLILDGPALIEKGYYDEIVERGKKNVLISLQKELGTDYFSDPASRLEMLRDKSNMVSTGWKTVDKLLYGGFNRGELTFFCGGPGCVTSDTKVRINKDGNISETKIVDLYGMDFDKNDILADSPDGWVKVVDCVKKPNKKLFRVEMNNGSIVDASYDHMFQKSDNTWEYADRLNAGDFLITVDGNMEIKSISNIDPQEVYDLSIDHINHRYYTNGISSHNTGKSLFLQNMAVNWSLMGLNVLYITLELSENLVSLRLDAMFTKLSTKDIIKDVENATLKLLTKKKEKTSYGTKPGRIQIKKMSEAGTTVNDIRAYIKEFEIQTWLTIDAVCIDYLDLLYPNSNKVDINNTFSKDKYTSEELRSLAAELNILCVTASQLNRCLTLDTKVLVSDPLIPREEYKNEYKELKDIQIGDYVLGSGDYVKVVNIFHQGKQKVYKITLENGKQIRCTSNHRIFTDKGLRSIDTGLDIGMGVTCFGHYLARYRNSLINKNVTTKISKIKSIEFDGVEDTMDIEVLSETNLFYANDMLVHNSSVSETDYDVSHIAGGISKINTADNVIAILTSDFLRKSGEYQLQFLKTRSSSGVGSRVYLGFNPTSLLIEDKIDGNPQVKEESKISDMLTSKLKKQTDKKQIKEKEPEVIQEKPEEKKLDPRLDLINKFKKE